ncbi:MAG: hypothetical protein HC904_16635 [Blastochloris sp.]|nr:hypothetical protein [Blastochloris sp.]
MVKVSHSFDRPRRMTVLDARIDNYPLAKELPIIDRSPVAFVLNKARLDARSRVEGSADGRVRSNQYGAITADWEMRFAGRPLVTFADTRLIMQDGKVRFECDPKKVRMSGLLQFLSDLAARASFQSGGLALHIEADPATPRFLAVSTLDIPFGGVSFGAFGISGLNLHALLGLEVNANYFQLKSAFALGRRDEPFILTLFVLGGGGWVEVSHTLTVTFNGERTLQTEVSIGIAVAASLQINFGFIQGGLFASFSIVANYKSGGSWGVEAILLFQGRVRVLGIVDVSITLLLSAKYERGGLIGTGEVAIRIKIGWFIRINIRKSVTYTFKKVRNQNRSNSALTDTNSENLTLSTNLIVGNGESNMNIATVSPGKRYVSMLA